MEKIQTGLRIPQERYEEIRAISESSGASVNSIILHLIDIGIKVIQKAQEQGDRVELHIEPRIDGLHALQDC